MDRFHVTLLGGEMNRFHTDVYLPGVAVSLIDKRVRLLGGYRLLALYPQEERCLRICMT